MASDVKNAGGASVRRPTLISLFDQTARLMVAELVDELRSRGYPQIRPAHSKVFEHLAPQGLRLTSLAARAQMTHPAMSELVRDLESMGFVSRVPDPADGRARLVQLTPSGRRLQRLAIGLIADIEDRWLARFTANSSSQLAGELRPAFELAASDPGRGRRSPP